MLRQFAAAWLVVFLAAALRQALGHGHITVGCVLGGLSLIGLLGVLKPALVRWLFIGATVIAFPIGWVVTQVTLLIMFYLIVTPVAFVFRVCGRDALQLRPRSNESTFWTRRGDPPEARRYLKQF